jgi:antitoxin component YwqK of YwqJK toxin-antitoxin module
MILYINRKSIFLFLFLFYSGLIIGQDDIIPNGYNKFYFPSGELSSEGSLRDGKPDGFWKTYFENGKIKSEGNRLDYLLDGKWKFYTEEGIISNTINYQSDKKNGFSEEFDEEGILYKKSYFIDDIKDSIETTYYTNGAIHTEINFVDGLEDGIAFEYASNDGRIITIWKYKKGYLRSTEKINRFDKADRKQGKWKVYYNDGIIRSDGYYKDGKKNGVFKEYDTKGSLIEINKFDEDVIDDEAEESVILDIRSTYYEDGTIKTIGTYKEGKKEGTHRVYDKNGIIIDGFIYKEGIIIGKGIIDEQGFYQGTWKFYFNQDTLQSEGEYEDSKKEGKWTYYYPNGKVKQIGKFKNGKPSGSWYWYYEDGVLHREESYYKGKEDGHSIEYDELENVITEGEYIDGYKEGEWYYKVGDTEEIGSYKDGEKYGKWIIKYDNDKINFKGSFVDGRAQGKHKFYYRNGSIKKYGKYKFGYKDGNWKTYDKEGKLLITITFKRGVEVKIDGVKISPQSIDLDDIDEDYDY